MLGVEPKLRQPLEHHRQDLLRFRPSQVRGTTEMAAQPNRHLVARVRPVHVEPVRVGNGRRIAVRGPQARQATDILLTLGRMTPSAMASR